MLPKVSVIVPVYKVEPFLKECIDSILSQKFKDFEILLIDDGSPDRCGEICDSFSEEDNRVTVIHKNNQGLSAARNIGIELARGQFVTFIDSDDVVEEGYLEVLIQLIYRYGAEVAACGSYVFDQTSSKTAKRSANYKPVIMSNREAVLSLYSRKGARLPITAWGKMYKKELFEEIRFPIGRIHEDDFIVPLLMYKAQKVVWISSELYGYRMRENSISHQRFSLKRYDGVRAEEECIRYFNSVVETEIVQVAERRKKELIAYYSLLARKAGIYRDVPKEYQVGKYQAIMTLKKSLPYDTYSYRVAQVYPRYISIEAHIRRALQLIGLKK